MQFAKAALGGFCNLQPALRGDVELQLAIFACSLPSRFVGWPGKIAEGCHGLGGLAWWPVATEAGPAPDMGLFAPGRNL